MTAVRRRDVRGPIGWIGSRRYGVTWSTIEAATGIDEETFDRLKHQFDSADDGEPHRN